VFQNFLVTMATLWSGIASAVLSGANPNLVAHFGVSSVVAELANGMFVFGFALGPQVFGPLSEVLGRKWPLALGLFLGSMFSIMTAGADNFATLMLGRFLGGVFGAAPYAIGGGWFHDVYDALHVQAGVAFFAVATAGGPALGPIIGAGLASTSTNYGWRWTEWFMAAFGLLVTFGLVFFMDESYAPVILKHEALKRRRETRNWAWHAELDTVSITPRDIFLRYILRPLKMLCTEPSE
jgi:multidrug resistance protein